MASYQDIIALLGITTAGVYLYKKSTNTCTTLTRTNDSQYTACGYEIPKSIGEALEGYRDAGYDIKVSYPYLIVMNGNTLIMKYDYEKGTRQY